MMKQYIIEVDEDVVNKQIQGIINDVFNRQLESRGYGAGEEIRLAVKDLIYSKKDEIVEMVVNRAVKEIVKKGLPKLLERMEEGGDV